jgi:hypothetical protein
MESRSTRVDGFVSVSDMAPILEAPPKRLRRRPVLLGARPVPFRPMRPFVVLGGIAACLGIVMLVIGVRQEVAFADCRVRCVAPDSWPVTLGILLFVGGGFLGVWTVAAEFAGRALHPAPRELEERARLRRVGVSGVARVLRATEAGTSPVGEPMVDVELTVELDGRAPYQVRQRTAVPRRRLGRLRPGRSVPVLVDPQDPQRLVVVWTPRPW